MRRLAPSELSRELRQDRTPHLLRRRWAYGLSLVGVAAGGIVGLYQMGILKRLPDFPSRFFDATKVDASDYGYRRGQAPDALFMIVNYAATALLTGIGGARRVREMPWAPVAQLAKTLLDVGTNLKLAREEWDTNRAFCGYCQTATLASIASVLASYPEARAAIDFLRAQLMRDKDSEWLSEDISEDISEARTLDTAA